MILPAAAFPGQTLYKVAVHGTKIQPNIVEGRPLHGFYAVHVVASANPEIAGRKALQQVRRRLTKLHPHIFEHAQLEVAEVLQLGKLFWRRSRYGYIFYEDE